MYVGEQPPETSIKPSFSRLWCPLTFGVRWTTRSEFERESLYLWRCRKRGGAHS